MMPALSWRRLRSLQTAFFVLLASAAIWLFVRQLPIEPVLTNDSQSYLNFSSTRPHGYPLFLAVYRQIRGDLAYLPATQAAIYLTSIAFLSIAIGRRLNSLPAGIGLFLVLYAYLDPNDVWSVMSEPLYGADATAACAALVFYVMRPNAAVLIAASVLFGIASVCRTIGFTLVAAFLVLLLCHTRIQGVRFARIFVFVILPIGLISSMSVLSNFLYSGSFSSGSSGGVSLLGKGLLLARPLPSSHALAQLNWTADVAGPARQAISELYNPFLKALVVRQYYEYLRWWIAWPIFERTWRAWQIGDETERGRLAGQLATAYVLEDLPGYLSLVGIDYLSLWTVPRYLTESEELGLRAELEAVGPLPLLSALAEAPEGKLEYYQIIPRAKGALFVYATRAVVAAFWVTTFLTIWLSVWGVRYAFGELTDLLFMVLAVHSVYVGTALVEAGLERYIWPTWPLVVAAPMLGACLVTRRLRGPSTTGTEDQGSSHDCVPNRRSLGSRR